MFEHVYLLHGKGGGTEGSVKLIENILGPMFQGERRPPTFHRLLLKHSDPNVLAEDSYTDFYSQVGSIEPGSLLIGISLGGLLAAKFAQVKPDLTAIALSSPTFLDGLSLRPIKNPRLYALYSSQDEVLKGHTEWAPYTDFNFDVDWMKDHNIDHQKYTVCLVLFQFLCWGDFSCALDSIEDEPLD